MHCYGARLLVRCPASKTTEQNFDTNFRANSDSGIADLNKDTVFIFRMRFDPNSQTAKALALQTNRFLGIANEVGQNLKDLLFVNDHLRHFNIVPDGTVNLN